jgi:hypothetical protein
MLEYLPPLTTSPSICPRRCHPSACCSTRDTHNHTHPQPSLQLVSPVATSDRASCHCLQSTAIRAPSHQFFKTARFGSAGMTEAPRVPCRCTAAQSAVGPRYVIFTVTPPALGRQLEGKGARESLRQRLFLFQYYYDYTSHVLPCAVFGRYNPVSPPSAPLLRLLTSQHYGHTGHVPL